MTIRIVKTPRSDAPDAVREAWIGLTLPIIGRRARLRLTYEVAQRRPNILRATFQTIFRIVKFQHVYAVHAKTAVDILARHRPDAADWWRKNAPHVLKRFGYLAFQDDVCVVESRIPAKPRLAAGIMLFVTLTMGLLTALAAYSSGCDLYTHDFGIYWDSARGAWLTVPEATTRQTLYVSLVLTALFSFVAFAGIRQFLRYNQWRNRVWRSQCGWCGYDVRRSPERCPECGEVAAVSDAPARRIGPGTKSNLQLLLIIAGAVILAVGIVVLLVLSGDGA